MGLVLSTVPSPITFDVLACSPVPTLSLQSPSALLTCNPVPPCIQMAVTEDDPFALEMRPASISSGAKRQVTGDSRKQNSETAFPREL